MDYLNISTGSLRKRHRPSEWGRCRALAVLALACFWPGPALGQVSPLPPEQAFRFSARLLDASTVEARFTIADGYYLYRDKLHFSIEPASVGLRVPELPSGKIKQDEFFGRVETYRGSVVVRLAVQDPPTGKPLVIRAESQGCADLGICYPPNVQRVTLALPDGSVVPNAKPAEKKAWFN